MVTFRNNNNNNNRRSVFRRNTRNFKSNGDKILSENYLQHADHFTRVLNERESFRREKVIESISENSLNTTGENIENSQKNSDKDLLDSPGDDNETQKNENSQVEIN